MCETDTIVTTRLADQSFQVAAPQRVPAEGHFGPHIHEFCLEGCIPGAMHGPISRVSCLQEQCCFCYLIDMEVMRGVTENCL